LAKPIERAVLCPACGFEFYFNCASSVAALLLSQGKLVLGVRAKAPQQGMLDPPGGFIEFDETAEQALRREVMEEFNLEISNPVYLTSAPNDYAYGGLVYKTTDLFFVCEVEDISTIKVGDDVGGYELTDPFALDPQRLAFPSGRIALRQLKELLRSTATP
jgi:ADP-ribose pyrophosphatase YjhB (NUDIX family)